MKHNGKEKEVGELLILGKKCPVLLTRDFNFAVIVEGSRFSAASIKQLQSVATKGTGDAEFQPGRLEIESLDTAARYINGKYEDAVRSVSISVSYQEKRRCYEACVSVHAKGRQHSKEFNAASYALAERIMEELRQRLAGQEWLALPTKRNHGASHYRDDWRVSLSEDWRNPRQATRVTDKQLLDSAQAFLASEFDIQDTATGDRAYAQLGFALRNGQKFTIEISEQ